MNTNVLGAVFRRNFVSYFANPTGYVFICVFVLLSAFAAFWPNEFFNTNLANLDQLNKVFPFIMLVFIPAITMSIWAEERREGTDELLLTIPAGDFDIVLGKYLAAVAIYSVSLIFSLLSNYIVLGGLNLGFLVLDGLGDPDVGLMLGTYAGYWFVGLAMLAVGMGASFLTKNLTVGYVLGAILNTPLVFAMKADAIFGPELAVAVKDWSIGGQFRDFGRGIISLGGIAYFLMIVMVMLYLSMVLIGRRHWVRGRSGLAMVVHYLVRGMSLVIVAVGVTMLCTYGALRLDVTSEQLSSLSPETRDLLSELDLKRPVQIEAFVSPSVPETYVQQRLNLRSMLRELEARGGANVTVRVNETERFSEEAARAEQRYGIMPRQVSSMQRGALSLDHVFMGVAFTCGLEKVILPFIDRGVPVEYELVRSICTVSQQKRQTIGILGTDAPLFGQFNMQTMSPGRDWPIIAELEKQYNVIKVDASQPITEKYDVLLAVQPSSLGPEQMKNFIAAVHGGQATAIFEDPFPVFAMGVPATSAPRQAPGGMNPMMMGRQQAPPKGDIGPLWRLLGVDFAPDQVVWQNYNPYPKASHFPEEFVFVDEGSGAKEAFAADNGISAGLQHMLFPFPGSVSKLNASGLEFTALAVTGDATGTVRFGEIIQMTPFGPRGGLNDMRRQIPTNVPYVLAAHIRGKLKADQPMADEAPPAAKEPEAKQPEAKPAAVPPVAMPPATMPPATMPPATMPPAAMQPEVGKPAGDVEINVVLVADIDMLAQDFFRLREQGEMPEAGIHFDFDNVTFILNALDMLADDQRFVEIRKRRAKHRTLTWIDKKTETAREETTDARERLIKQFDEAKQKEQDALNKKIDSLKKRKNIDPQQLLIEVATAQQVGQRRLETKVEQLTHERDREINKIETKLALETRRVQNASKMWAVFLPPIPPLVVAIIVFFTRRSRERLGVSRARLR